MTKKSDSAEVIIVGSGINSLVCAALLAINGKSVIILERDSVSGGCIRTESLFPGYQHDIMSSWYPLFVGSPAYAELKSKLDDAGLEFVQNEYSTGVVFPDGSGLALKNDIEDTVRRMETLWPGDGEAVGKMADQLFNHDAELTFGLLGNSPYAWQTAKLLFSEWRKRGFGGLTAFAGDAIESFRRWSSRTLSHDKSRALIAPWVLHTGLGPDEASSALIGKLTFAAVVAGGMPVVKGGSGNIVNALIKVIQDHGGTVINDAFVEEIITSGLGKQTKAIGVVSHGKVYQATEAVVCNVTPKQLYRKLLSPLPHVSPEVQSRADAYQFGRGGMQIHFALSAPPSWSTPELINVPLVHLTESMEQVCLSVTEANNGLLPSKPTLGIGQPTAVDPSRAPDGGWILWVQMQELPSVLKGDALNEIDIPDDGKWTPEVRELMADRVQKRLELVMPGLSDIIVGRKAYCPADLETLNSNLVGGDPYSGICSPDQFFWLRPFAPANGAKAHNTPISNVYHIGASTHPGPGLGGTSGYLVAKDLL
ncbi:phytoene desaturase family protein [Vibrio atypicus]|uniref:phytoene desaturase family protein n=1 Tax=Vibrio atypicus TaxID=558271 RepID=UPI0013587E28|nr:NAD(P)/FAD-dependent oxidoreductase [Vibrio atypicus]